MELYLGAETNTVPSKKGDLDGNQEKSNKEKSNKEKSNKEKSNKEKSKSQKKIINSDCFSFRLMLIAVDLLSIQFRMYKLVSFQRPTNTTIF
jgi:hypothetical protein